MIYLTLVLVLCLSESTAGSLYMVVQKPVVSYSDPIIFPFINFTSLRFGRENDLYYSNLHLEVAVAMDNNITGTYHFYNMTASADHLPPMPFTKGRIGVVWFYKKKVAIKGYCDLELKRKKN